MKKSDVLALASMPLQSPTYPRGPYRFFNRQYLVLSYKTDAAAFLFGDADIARHGDFQAAADGVTIDCRDNNFRRIFQAHQDFMAVQREVVLKAQRLT